MLVSLKVVTIAPVTAFGKDEREPVAALVDGRRWAATVGTMGRVIYYTASSLDGFVATSDHSLDWLLSRDVDHEGELGFAAFDRSIGALIMGRNTYDWMVDGPLADSHQWPHHQETWVMTTRPADASRFPDARLHFSDASAEEVVAAAQAAAGEKDVWCVGGGRTAAWLMDAGLVDEVQIAFAPVMLGSGIPVLGRHVELELLAAGRNRDFTVCRYAVVH